MLTQIITVHFTDGHKEVYHVETVDNYSNWIEYGTLTEFIFFNSDTVEVGEKAAIYIPWHQIARVEVVKEVG